MADVTVQADDSQIRDVPRGRGGRVLAWGLVVVWLLWALARLAGADRVGFLTPVLIPAMAIVPYAAAGSVVPLVAAYFARDRIAVAVALVVVGLFAWIVLPRAFADGGPRASGPELRVLTANLKYGAAGDASLVDLVRRTHADVLSVQEFTPDAAVRLDQAGLGRVLPFRLIDPRPGPQGTGLYARYPLTRVPHRRAAEAMPTATLAVPGTSPVRITAAHPTAPLGPAARTWLDDLAAIPPATPHGQVGIVAGDLNSTLDHAGLRRLIGTGFRDAADAAGQGLVTTFRPRPPITIDHVLADRRCAVLGVKVYLQPRSDHRALLARLRLP